MSNATTGVWIHPPVSEVAQCKQRVVRDRITEDRTRADLARAHDEYETARDNRIRSEDALREAREAK